MSNLPNNPVARIRAKLTRAELDWLKENAMQLPLPLKSLFQDITTELDRISKALESVRETFFDG